MDRTLKQQGATSVAGDSVAWTLAERQWVGGLV